MIKIKFFRFTCTEIEKVMTVIKHLHWVFIAIYLLLYLSKCILFITGQSGFQNFRKKTLIPENIFALGFFITGIMMLVRGGGFSNYPVWFHLKFTLVILSIPIGIVGFKKQSKALVGLSMIFLLYVLGLALTKNPALFL